MNKNTDGELAFEQYLNQHGIPFEHEPPLDFTDKLIDYVIDHPTHGKIYLEVKDIYCPPPEGIGAFDPYEPIRRHIDAARSKFRDFPDELCALVLFAPPGSFVSLSEPHVMLGSMCGNFGWNIPVDPDTGSIGPIESGFIVGEGRMIQQSRDAHTRIAALISLLNYWPMPDDWSDALAAREKPRPCVKVWENATAKRKLPQDLFRGEMDEWWSTDGSRQWRSFIGETLRARQSDRQP